MTNLLSYKVIYFRLNSSRKFKMAATKTLLMFCPSDAINKNVISYCIYKMKNYVFIGFFVIFVVLYYVLINISTNASTPSTAIGTIQPCFATGKAQSVTSHLTATSHYFQQRFLSNIHVTLQGQDSSLPSTAFQPILFVDADMEQALISLSILAPEAMVLDSW